jgi:spermidine synthase
MTSWQKHNLAAIQKRLAVVQRAQAGVLFERQSKYNYAIVRRTAEQVLLCYRHMHHRVEEIESRLGLADPLALLSEYTQAMMVALAWQPAPRHVLLIGLGGGRLQMVLHHYVELASLYTVELDPLILDIAQRFFGFVADERQHVIIKDGRDYLRSFPTEAPYDLIVLDAYRAGGVPLHLSTREFYDECRAVLAPGGAVVTNLQSGTSLYDSARKTFSSAFRSSTVFPLLAGNVIVIGSDADPLSLEEIHVRARAVEQRYGFNFSLSEVAQMAITPAPYRSSAPILHDPTWP